MALQTPTLAEDDADWLTAVAELEADELSREAYQTDEAEAVRHEANWPSLRRELLRRGGIAAGPYSRYDIPRAVYRVRGAAPDQLAAELAYLYGWSDTDSMLAKVARIFAGWREKFPPRLRSAPAPKVRLAVPAPQPSERCPWTPRAPRVLADGWAVVAGAQALVAGGFVVAARRELDGEVYRWRAEAPRPSVRRPRGWRRPVPAIAELAAIRERRRAVLRVLSGSEAPASSPPEPRGWRGRLLAWLARS